MEDVKTMSKRVLLISNSTRYDSGYLDHAESEIRSFLGKVKSVLFVPFALYDRDAYTSMARELFQKMDSMLPTPLTHTGMEEGCVLSLRLSGSGSRTIRF
jgi:hypothetical protein